MCSFVGEATDGEVWGKNALQRDCVVRVHHYIANSKRSCTIARESMYAMSRHGVTTRVAVHGMVGHRMFQVSEWRSRRCHPSRVGIFKVLAGSGTNLRTASIWARIISRARRMRASAP